jgi:RHS repeat-associated protein
VGDDVGSLRYFQWSYGVDYQIDTFTTNDGTDTYLYDDADQLIGIDSTTQDDQDFVYDGNGNRITVDRTDSSGTTTDDYDHEEANRLTSDGTYTYEYDDEGNLTRKYDTSTEVIYKWDRRNRLTDVKFKDAPTGGNVTKTVEYEYNINDRRISKTVKDGSGTVTDQEFYAWDNDHNTLKIEADGTVEATNLYGPVVDMIFASEDAVGEVLWAVTDNQNTVRDIADFDEVAEDTSIVASREYDIFGNLIAVTGSDPSASDKVNAGYTARFWDADAELYYYRARWYDSGIGRFISEDPLGFDAGDVNVQRYVANNVANATDPSGLVVQLGGRNVSVGSQIYSTLATNSIRGRLLTEMIADPYLHNFDSYSELDNYLSEAEKRVPQRWPTDRSDFKDVPWILSFGRDDRGLPTGLGTWSPSSFFRCSQITPSTTRYGCGGVMCVRAGLPQNSPTSVHLLEGAMAFVSYEDALRHLRDNLKGNGLVIALQQRRHFAFVDADGEATGEVFTAGSTPASSLQIHNTGNYCSLLGTEDDWYWEDGTGPWRSGGKIRHYRATADELHRLFVADGDVLFIVVPNTPSTSPTLDPENPYYVKPSRNRLSEWYSGEGGYGYNR